jgi:hypothetical protein
MTPLKFGEYGAMRLFFPVMGGWLIPSPFLRVPLDLACTRTLDRSFLPTLISPEPLEIANYVECDERRVYNDKQSFEVHKASSHFSELTQMAWSGRGRQPSTLRATFLWAVFAHR